MNSYIGVWPKLGLLPIAGAHRPNIRKHKSVVSVIHVSSLSLVTLHLRMNAPKWEILYHPLNYTTLCCLKIARNNLRNMSLVITINGILWPITGYMGCRWPLWMPFTQWNLSLWQSWLWAYVWRYIDRLIESDVTFQ